MMSTSIPTLSIAEAARLLGRSYFSTHDLLLRGELHGFREGRAWRVLESSVESFAKREKEAITNRERQALGT